MKKLLALLLALLMVFSLAACGSDDSSKEEEGKKQSQDKDEGEDKGSDKRPSSNPGKVTFNEQLVVDNDECMIKITEVGEGDYSDFAIKVQLENKSDDTLYMFTVQEAAVNGVSCDASFASEVAAGKKSNDEIEFDEYLFDGNDIGAYTDIELTFRVYDSENWDEDDVVYETVHVYPYGEDKAVVYEREPESSDTVIADNEYVKATVIGYEVDDYGYYCVKLFFENKTDTTVMFNVDEASVNGYMADPYFAREVGAGKCRYAEMSWSEETFEENGITDVETIEFVFEAYDSNDWSADDYIEKQVTLNP